MEEVALSFYIYELTLYGTCLCSFKSQMLPTKTLGISTASPRALSKDSLICLILSNDCLEIIENTKMYPSTPTDAFLDRREYSSYSIKQSINICKRVIIGISNEKMETRAFPYHSGSINNVGRKIDFSESNNLVVGILYRWIITMFCVHEVR
jgi:hypothetical protein